MKKNIATEMRSPAVSGGGQYQFMCSPCPSPRAGLDSPRNLPSPQQQQQQQVLVPTTFVQADTSSFKEVVQRLTGATEEDGEKMPVTMPARYVPKQPCQPAEPVPPRQGIEVGPRKPAFKLHERRESLRNLQFGLGITLPPRCQPYNHCYSNGNSPAGGRVSACNSPFGGSQVAELSPSVINMMNTALVLSPVTPLGSDPFDCEEKAIAQKGFYLHPSPRTTPRGEPELLPLFPVHSPNDSQSSSSSP